MYELLSSNAANFWWGIAIFAIFVVLLLRIGVNQVLRAVDAREGKIAHELRESAEVYAKALKIQEELDQRMRQAEMQMAALMATAAERAEAHNRDILEQGRKELEALRQRSQRDIESARSQALAQLREEIAEIVVQVAEKVIRTHLDNGHHEELVDQAIASYQNSGRTV